MHIEKKKNCIYSKLITGLLVGRRKKSQISRDFQGQIRGKNGRFRGNFAGIFEASFTEKRLVKNGRFRGSFSSKFHWKATGFALIWGSRVFNETRRSYSIYSGFIPQYEIVLYKQAKWTVNIIKTNKRISCFVEYLLYPIACCLPHLRNSFYDDSSFFFNIWGTLVCFSSR